MKLMLQEFGRFRKVLRLGFCSLRPAMLAAWSTPCPQTDGLRNLRVGGVKATNLHGEDF